jgi:transposase
MKKNHLLGLDVAQKNIEAQLVRADGSRCWRGSLPTSQTGWRQLEQTLAAHHVHLADTLVVIEATGVFHLGWAERLTRADAEVYVLNPLLAARLESAANALRGHKTDRVDVAKLCEIGRLYTAELARFRYRPAPARQGLRQLDHARATVRSLLTNAKKSLKSHLELVFPALAGAGIQADTVRAGAILAQASTAGAWRALPQVEREKLAGTKCAALDQACAETLADEALAQACVPAMRALLATMHALEAQLHACEQDVLPRLPRERVALIASIPGFGERTAAVMATYLPEDLSQWGPRKKTVARLQALFGTDPRLRSSGNWAGKVKLSKRGIASARTALFQAAFCSLHADPENAAYYKRLRDVEKKTHKEAIVDVMRKQLRRLVAVLRNDRPFEARIPSTVTKRKLPRQPNPSAA